jgi:hypothetical protein
VPPHIVEMDMFDHKNKRESDSKVKYGTLSKKVDNNLNKKEVLNKVDELERMKNSFYMDPFF